MRLGGWARLGIVLSVLYAFPVWLVGYDSRPRMSGIEFFWELKVASVIAEHASKQGAKKYTANDVRAAFWKGEVDFSEKRAFFEQVESSPTEAQKPFSAEVARINSEYREEIAEFPAKQRWHWFLAFVWWAAGTALLFGFGLTVRWIYRGFRGTRA